MKNIFYALFMFILFSSCAVKKTNLSSNDITVKQDKSITINTVSENNYIIIKLVNESSKSKYLLTSYLNNRFTYNDNLYATKEDTLIASFKPILKYLGTVKTDVLIVDDNSILTEKQAIYKFLELLPNKEVSIKFDKKQLSEVPYYKEGKAINFQFAIYENIDLLKVQGVDYDKKYQKAFIEQAKNYKIVETLHNQ